MSSGGKYLAYQNSARFAFEFLNKIRQNRHAKDKAFVVEEKNVTTPAIMIQEQQLTNATNTYTFNFSSDAPQPDAQFNNVVLPKTSVAVCFGFQMLLGYGATANRRSYQTYGSVLDDNVVYNGLTKLQFEQNTFINQMDNLGYRVVNGTNFDPLDGVILIQPLRIFDGNMGVNQIILTMPSVTGLAISANVYISFRLHIALGNAKG